MGQGERIVEGGAGGDDPVGQAHRERLGGAHGTTGEDQVHGTPVTDDAGQAHRAQVAEGYAEASAEHTEDGILGGHPQIAPQGQLDPARHGVPLDGGDDGFGEREPGAAHGPRAVVGDGAAIALGECLEVGAGAEHAGGTREDGDRAALVGVEGEEGLAELVGAHAVHRIAALRAVDGHHGHRAVVLHPEAVGAVGHVRRRRRRRAGCSPFMRAFSHG